MKNYYPFAEMPSAAHLDHLERRAIACDKKGYKEQSSKLWARIAKGEAMRRDAGLSIYQEQERETT